MTLVSNRLGDTLAAKARSKLGIRFGRFTVAAITAFATTEVVLTICAGPLQADRHLGQPDQLVLRCPGELRAQPLGVEAEGPPEPAEGDPAVLGGLRMVVVILTLATKFAYHSAGWMGLTGAERVLFVDAVYGVANIGTFLLRFLFFHYVLFAGSPADRARSRRRGAGLDRPRARAVRPGGGVHRAAARGARRGLRRPGVTADRPSRLIR